MLAALSDGPAGADTLARRSGLPADGLAATLAQLELDGHVVGTDGVYRVAL